MAETDSTPLMPFLDPVKMDVAIKRRDEADYQCYMKAAALRPWADLIRGYLNRLGEGVEEWDELTAALDEREEANEQVVQAIVANRPANVRATPHTQKTRRQRRK